jgi:hypothetical protein
MVGSREKDEIGVDDGEGCNVGIDCIFFIPNKYTLAPATTVIKRTALRSVSSFSDLNELFGF